MSLSYAPRRLSVVPTSWGSASAGRARPSGTRVASGTDPGGRPTLRRRLAPVIITVVAWLAAFIVVWLVLTVFAAQLAVLPVAVRALLISGLLVAVMVNVVMPTLTARVNRWVVGTSREHPADDL